MVNNSSLPKIVIICGPTGVGKTSFAIELARHFGGQIVGADSMQIYRYMDIGTAKPTAEERAVVPHHMVDIIDPDEDYDAAAYGAQAQEVVDGLLAKGILPLVVGGTGLYIKALTYGLFEERASDPEIRQKLKKQLVEQGSGAMHTLLQARDPEAARRLHPNDTFRVLRALEVVEVTGRPLSDHQKSHAFERPRYETLTIGLTLPRDQLYERINRRVDGMLDEGLLEEVQGLVQKGYKPELKSMLSLGYRHMVDFIQGRRFWEETVYTLKRDHRHYAKRQYTWFNRVANIHWLAPEQSEVAQQMLAQWLYGMHASHPKSQGPA